MLPAGTRLGPYEILEPIGAGGMGEVHKARDTRLNRIVAIKKSLTPFDERFEREAHAIASLNHPAICALFDVGPDYLVMEYVEGKPLTGPVPLDEALVTGDVLAGRELGGVHFERVRPQRGLRPILYASRLYQFFSRSQGEGLEGRWQLTCVAPRRSRVDLSLGIRCSDGRGRHADARLVPGRQPKAALRDAGRSVGRDTRWSALPGGDASAGGVADANHD